METDTAQTESAQAGALPSDSRVDIVPPASQPPPPPQRNPREWFGLGQSVPGPGTSAEGIAVRITITCKIREVIVHHFMNTSANVSPLTLRKWNMSTGVSFDMLRMQHHNSAPCLLRLGCHHHLHQLRVYGDALRRRLQHMGLL